MKQISKKCILFLLILCVLIPRAAFAADTEAETASEPSMREQIIPELNYIDKVYQYDVSEADKAVLEDESLQNSALPTVKTSKYPVEIGTVLGLGLMSLAENGTFDEMSLVPYNEYATVVFRLVMGTTSTYYEELYATSGQTEITTHEQAIMGIMDGLGYTAACERSSYSKVAISAGLLKNFAYSPEKSLTKGELAQLVYNALMVDKMVQSTIGVDESYSVEKGSTLLWDTHKAVKIEGVVTAADGVDLYSVAMPNDKYIYIDRVAYLKGNATDVGLLGQQVFGYAVCEDDEYTIVYLDYHKNNETLHIPIDSINSISNNNLYYEDEDGEQKISLRNIKRIVYNHDIADDYRIEELLQCEGDITICTLKDGFQALIINDYESFTVSAVSTANDYITLRHNMTYAGSKKINVKETKERYISFIKNGEVITLSDIEAGNIISVSGNKAGTVMNIFVSDSSIKNGFVSQVNGKEVTIGKGTYQISESFDKALEIDEALSTITVGATGNFYLTYDNRIADFVASKGVEYGLMRGAKSRDVFGNGNVEIKLFSEAGLWKVYPLADNVQFDGEKKSASDAYKVLVGEDYAAAGVFDNLIQYKLNADGEISYLDTIYESDTEISTGDTTRLLYNGMWEGELDWTVSTRLATLEGSRYKLMNNTTVVFSVPNNLDAENKYASIKVSSLPIETNATVKIYSADEYFRAGAIIENHTGAGSEERFYRMVVDKVISKVNADGDIVTAIQALMLNVSGECISVEYELNEDTELNPSTLKRGDVLVHTFLGDNTIDCRVLVNSNLEDWEDKITNPAGADEEMWGTVYSVDTENDFLSVQVGDELYSYEFEGAILYDRQNDRLTGITLYDLSEGDKVYNRGSNSRGRFVVYR